MNKALYMNFKGEARFLNSANNFGFTFVTRRTRRTSLCKTCWLRKRLENACEGQMIYEVHLVGLETNCIAVKLAITLT